MNTAIQQLIRDEAARFLGRELTEEEWNQALPKAERKLQRIIDREGDANGKRLEPWYLGKLVEEAVIEEAFSRYTIARSLEIQAQRQAASAVIEKAAPFGDPTTPTLYRPDKQLVNPTAKPTRRRMTNEAINLEA